MGGEGVVEKKSGGSAPKEIKRNVPHKLETQLLPPERFKGEQEGEVIDIKKIGEITAVLRKINGHSQVFIHDGKGNNVLTANLDPSSIEIAKASNYNTAQENSSLNANIFEATIANMNYSGEAAKTLIENWKALDKEKYFNDHEPVYFREILRHNPVFLPATKPGNEWRTNVAEDSAGNKIFLFSIDSTHFLVKPKPPFVKASIEDSEAKTDLERSRKILSNDLKLDEEATIFRIIDADDKELVCYSGNNPIADPSDPDSLFFVNAGQVYKLNLRGVAGRASLPELVSNLNIPDPQELHLDPNGNFIVARSNENKLIIYEKETGEEVKSFENVKGPVLIDEQGDITFADTQGKLHVIQTNFQAIPSGESGHSEERKAEKLKALQKKFADLDLNKVDRQVSDQISENDVARTLKETISKQVTEIITTSQKAEDIEGVLDRLQGLKADPANKSYTGVVDEFVEQARAKLSSIRQVELNTGLTEYGKTLESVKTVGDTIGLDEMFAKLLELRQKIDIADPQIRREIEQKLLRLQTKKDVLNTQYQGELVAVANQAFPQIEQLIKETGSSTELAYASTSGPAQQFERMLVNIKDPDVRKQLRDRYNAVKSEQRNKLEERVREVQDRDNRRYAQIVDEAKQDLTSLKEQIEKLSDTKLIDRFDKDPLVTAYKAKLFALSPELREIEEKKLEIILGARKRDVEHRKELGAIGEAGELKFGQVSFPVYKEPQRLWQPKLIQRKNGFYADLVFQDSQGRIFRPGGDTEIVVENDLNSDRTGKTIENYRKEAEEYFRGIKRKVPDFDEKWRITDYHTEKLEEFTEALNLQLDNHRGIYIWQGEAGTGKNVLVDMLANLSNREVVTVACNENSVKEDLTYEFYYDPDKGTYKLPSRLIEGLQKPGAIILFDEINALKPGIAKLMNSLFDYRRRLYLPEGGKERDILADPTVLFVGTMNPQNYAGVNRLSPEIKSRARIGDLEYPPFEVEKGRQNTRHRSDEAEMLAKYMETLSTLTQKEFKLCWQYLINKDTANGAGNILDGNPDLEPDIRRVYDVVRVANGLRRMYEAYQVGESNEPMDFPTSLREVIDIVLEMNHKKGVGDIMKRVIVPKIDDRRQKKIVGDTIDAILAKT